MQGAGGAFIHFDNISFFKIAEIFIDKRITAAAVLFKQDSERSCLF